MRRQAIWLQILLTMLFSQGCSLYLAASQPPKVDVGAFSAGGMPRDAVVAKLGAPTSSVKHEDGTRTELYEFYEGSATGWKVGRATFNLIADIFTLGLWELIASPAELMIKGDKVSARAEFDDRDRLTEFVPLGDADRGRMESKEKTHAEMTEQSPTVEVRGPGDQGPN